MQNQRIVNELDICGKEKLKMCDLWGCKGSAAIYWIGEDHKGADFRGGRGK